MKFRIKEKLLAGYLVIISIFTVAFIVALMSINLLFTDVQMTHDHSLVVTRASIKIEVIVTSMHRYMKDVTLSQNQEERDKYIGIVNQNEQEALLQFKIIRKQILGSEGLFLAQKAGETFINWRPIRQRVIGLMEAGNFTQAQNITQTEGKKYVELIIDIIVDLERYVASNALGFSEESINTANNARAIIITMFIMGSIISVVIALYLSLSITKKLNTIGNAAVKMTRGELNQIIKIKGSDELTQLAQSFNSMAAQLSVSYESLENKVKNRTKDLSNANKELQKLKDELEVKVSERTIELQEKIEKLDRNKKAMLLMVEDLNKTTSELKTAQKELIRKERLAILGQFSGSVSHELRNSLGVIDSSVYYLKMKLKKYEKKVQEHLDRITMNVYHATSIIQSLLNLTRMKKPIKTKNNLEAIIMECIANIKIPDSIQIKKNIYDKNIVVNVEREQFIMAFKNIIKNAVEAIQGEGILEISINKTTNNHVEVHVKDSGIGITMENMDTIFDPLFTTKTKGIGFGLSLTKMIIDNHDGSIKVESEPGKGSTFIVSLPMNNSNQD